VKTEISQPGLRDIVAWATAAVPPRVDAARPELGGIRLEAAGGLLTASAYDRQVARRWSAPAQTGEPGVALPPARVLAGVTDRLPARPVELETDPGENALVLTCGAARYAIPLLDAALYPQIPGMPDPAGSFAGPALVRAVERTVLAADPDAAEPARTVVRFEPDAEGETVTLVATDTRRVSVARIPCETVDWAMPAAHIPASALSAWARAMKSGGAGRVQAGFTRGAQESPLTIGLADGSRETSIRLTALEEYVNWRRFATLPAENFLAAEVDTAGLVAAVKPLAALIPDLAPLFLTFTKGEVRLATGRVGGRASGADSFPVAYDGPRFQLAFRASFLEDALTATGGVATLIMTGPSRAVYVTPVTESGKGKSDDDGGQFLHVVMPIGNPTEPPPE
jgi:DNA polymerase III subunit beta